MRMGAERNQNQIMTARAGSLGLRTAVLAMESGIPGERSMHADLAIESLDITTNEDGAVWFIDWEKARYYGSNQQERGTIDPTTGRHTQGIGGRGAGYGGVDLLRMESHAATYARQELLYRCLGIPPSVRPKWPLILSL
jgi:hypothetical protein